MVRMLVVVFVLSFLLLLIPSWEIEIEVILSSTVLLMLPNRRRIVIVLPKEVILLLGRVLIHCLNSLGEGIILIRFLRLLCLKETWQDVNGGRNSYILSRCLFLWGRFLSRECFLFVCNRTWSLLLIESFVSTGFLLPDIFCKRLNYSNCCYDLLLILQHPL